MPEGGQDLIDRLRQRREELLALADKHGLAEVRVFGSVARGTATADSDIDLLVDFDAERYGLGPLVTFRADAEELLGHKVDVATPELLPDGTRERVLSEAVRF